MTPREFGATPWGHAWVRTIEPTLEAPNPLLPRARSLARNHVATVSVVSGRVDAEVATAGATHRVRIDVPPWPEPTRAEAARLATDAAATRRGLAAGDLPDALFAELGRRGIATAVRPDADTSTCDCRTRRRPCVHVLAAVYALAQLIDERPVLALEIRSLVPAPDSRSTDWIDVGELEVAGFYGGPRAGELPWPAG